MKKSLLLAMFPLTVLFAEPALAQSRCVVEGGGAIMGANMSAAFDVQAGQGCMYDINPQGTLTSSELSQRPQHGTVRMIDKDTWVYEPAPGYRGPDSFAITATGQSIDEKPGTSVLSFKVNVK